MGEAPQIGPCPGPRFGQDPQKGQNDMSRFFYLGTRFHEKRKIIFPREVLPGQPRVLPCGSTSNVVAREVLPGRFLVALSEQSRRGAQDRTALSLSSTPPSSSTTRGEAPGGKYGSSRGPALKSTVNTFVFYATNNPRVPRFSPDRLPGAAQGRKPSKTSSI